MKSFGSTFYNHVDLINKIDAAIELWDKVWESEEFKKRVLAFQFSQTRDSSEAILNNALKANPRGLFYELNEVPNGSEMASTNTSTGVTSLQIIYLQGCEVLELVETLAHEFMHTPQAGSYTHSYLCTRWMPWTLSRPNSVPYKIGSLTRELAKNI